jgi:hypothetical protein
VDLVGGVGDVGSGVSVGSSAPSVSFAVPEFQVESCEPNLSGGICQQRSFNLLGFFVFLLFFLFTQNP